MLLSKKYCPFVKALALIFLIGSNTSLFSQIKISGPTCVVSLTEYPYKVQGRINKNLPVKICITGGTILNASQTCIESKTDELNVVWNVDAPIGSIKITSSEGNTILNVTKTTELMGGTIDSAVKVQSLDSNKKASIISCLPAKGGSCLPLYVYQWQCSDNALNWKDITGSIGENLKLTKLPRLTTYYRRKVVEKVSNTVMYSDVATVFIVPVERKFIDY